MNSENSHLFPVKLDSIVYKSLTDELQCIALLQYHFEYSFSSGSQWSFSSSLYLRVATSADVAVEAAASAEDWADCCLETAASHCERPSCVNHTSLG